MSTQPETVEHILENLAELGTVRARKMFGEYALYYNEKVVALICDDTLFIKVTEPGLSFVPEKSGIPPYPGAKKYLPVTAEQINNITWLQDFVKQTEAVLPKMKPKKRKQS